MSWLGIGLILEVLIEETGAGTGAKELGAKEQEQRMTEKRRCADCPFAAKTVPNGDMYECVAPTPVEDTYRTYYGLFLGGLEEIQQERPCRCYFQDWHTDTVLKEHLWFSENH